MRREDLLGKKIMLGKVDRSRKRRRSIMRKIDFIKEATIDEWFC